MIWDTDNQAGVGLLTSAIDFGELEDGLWHSVTIQWEVNTQNISFTVDGANAGSFTNDLVNNYFGGSSQVYFGFAGSTGGEYNDQRIRFSNGFCDFQVFVDDDNDGIGNSVDLDSDNDGLWDALEAGHGETITDGRITGTMGANGFDNTLETAAESGLPNYTITDSDSDDNADAYETDSDDDGCNDTTEAMISDTDNDGTAGTGSPTVNANGLVVGITYTLPPHTNWQNAAIYIGCTCPQVIMNRHVTFKTKHN